MLCGHVMAMRISIHALREEGDALPARRRWSGSYFYPRPPRGGRRFTGKAALEWKLFLSTPSARRTTKRLEGLTPIQKFLSTPSARRATRGPAVLCSRRHISIHALREEGDEINVHVDSYGGISIHALREEGDPGLPKNQPTFLSFLSTPSARRATRHRAPCSGILTISIHALREEGDVIDSCIIKRCWNFYPRPPRGGRPTAFASALLSTRYFYPRPPRGGRPNGFPVDNNAFLFLSTPSARRATE